MLIEPAPLALTTSDGLCLEAELAQPAPGETVRAAAVLAHPHPQQGGTMRSIVPGTLFGGLPAAGVVALRFNFRGVGDSEGSYGGGVAEQADVVAAIDAVSAAVAVGTPVVLAGWSFGADVCLSVGDERVAGWFCAAPPLRVVEPSSMVAGSDPRPKLLAVPERDQFRPPDEVRALTASWPNCRVEGIGGADHFFFGRTDQLTPLCLELIAAAR